MKKIVTFTAAVFLAVSSTSVLAESKPIKIAYINNLWYETIARIAGFVLERADHTVRYVPAGSENFRNADWVKAHDFLPYRPDYLTLDDFVSNDATDKPIRVGLAVHNSVRDDCNPTDKKEINLEDLYIEKCIEALKTIDESGAILVSFPEHARAKRPGSWEKLDLREPFTEINWDHPDNDEYVKRLIDLVEFPGAAVVYGYSPSWMDNHFTFIKLPDSLNKKEIFSYYNYRAKQCSECAEGGIRQNMIRKQLEKENPSAFKILSNVFLTGEQIAELDEWLVNSGESSELASQQWITKYEHVWKRWIQ